MRKGDFPSPRIGSQSLTGSEDASFLCVSLQDELKHAPVCCPLGFNDRFCSIYFKRLKIQWQSRGDLQRWQLQQNVISKHPLLNQGQKTAIESHWIFWSVLMLETLYIAEWGRTVKAAVHRYKLNDESIANWKKRGVKPMWTFWTKLAT